MRRQGFCNAALDDAAVERHCRADQGCLGLLERAMRQFGLSARGHRRVLKVARTIADMDRRDQIGPSHITEALSLRAMDRHARG